MSGLATIWKTVKKMRLKHNKKRNTAFLYETLIKELTKSVVEKDIDKKEKLNSLIKECNVCIMSTKYTN